MPAELIPTTELEAVNAILASIGEAPVEEVTDDLTDAQLARDLIREESRAEQAKGHIFNTDKEVELEPDGDGYIWLPDATLKIIQTDRTITRRGQRLYSTVDHSYVFTDAVTADVVVFLDYTDLPETLRRYVYVRAARAFQAKLGGDRTLFEISSHDVMKATADWMNAEAEEGNYNALNSNALVARMKAGR